MNYKKTTSIFEILECFQINGLSQSQILSIAFQCGFMKRASKKINATDFLASLCSISVEEGTASYNNMASRFYSSSNIIASKQAFWKKVDTPCIVFFKAILERIIKLKINTTEFSAINKKCSYKRILVQDSTIIKLPTHLFKKFSGARNRHSVVCNARIQGVYDLLSGCFVSFSIDPYSKNDILAASEIELQEGDLVLRDRGYYLNDEIQRHIDNGADCIYRYKHKTQFLNSITEKPIDLLKELEKNKELDIVVLLNNKDRTKVRLVAVPVNEEIGNKRRMKAKKESKSKKNISEEVLKLMSWTIFITTISSDKSDFKELMAMYRLRWRIEVLFKIWKSYLKFGNIHNVSECQLNAILLSRFIMIVLYVNIFFQPFYLKIRKQYGKFLSIMKLVNYLVVNPNSITEIIEIGKQKSQLREEILKPILKYCTYDSRKRLNYCQLFELAFLS
ncbi:MAG: IS4 family transposase [Bacteroidales bacterium]